MNPSTRLSTGVESPAADREIRRTFHNFSFPAVTPATAANWMRLYWHPSGGVCFQPLRLHSHEADLSAKRAPSQAQARLSRQDVDPGRPADPEAPPREGPQAPVGVGACSVRTVFGARGISM